MSALARLWQRAPLWRGVLLSACASTALGVIYADQWLPARGGAGPVPSSASRYVPLPAPLPAAAVPATAAASPSLPPQAAPSQASQPAAPAYGQSFTGTVPLGDRLVPLRWGKWTVVGSNQGLMQDGRPFGTAMLARMEQSRVSAVAVLFGSAAPDPTHAGFAPDYQCQKEGVLYARVLAAVDHGPQECWSVDVALAPSWDRPSAATVVRAGVGDLKQRGAALPGVALRVLYMYADQDRALTAYYVFSADHVGIPEDVPGMAAANWSPAGIARAPDRQAFLARVRAWATQWQPLVKRGFKGELTAADVASAPDGSP